MMRAEINPSWRRWERTWRREGGAAWGSSKKWVARVGVSVQAGGWSMGGGESENTWAGASEEGGGWRTGWGDSKAMVGASEGAGAGSMRRASSYMFGLACVRAWGWERRADMDGRING